MRVPEVGDTFIYTNPKKTHDIWEGVLFEVTKMGVTSLVVEASHPTEAYTQSFIFTLKEIDERFKTILEYKLEKALDQL